MSLPRFFTKRIHLDTLFSRSTSDVTTHWVGSSFKAFAVLRSSDANFELKLVPDPTNGSIQGMPLREGFFHNFKTMPNNAVFENSLVQPGEWVDVLISTEDELESNPSMSRDEASTVELGHARGELDGLTRQVRFSWNFTLKQFRCTDIENKNWNDGTLNGNPIFFRCPAGYSGEVIGCTITVRAQVGVSAGPEGDFNIYATPSGIAYVNDNISDAYNIGKIYETACPAVGDYNVRILNDTAPTGSLAHNRGGAFIHEGEVLAVANPIGGTGGFMTSGSIEGFFLIRLRPMQR